MISESEPRSIGQALQRELHPPSTTADLNTLGLIEDLVILLSEQNGDLIIAIQNLALRTPATEVHFGVDSPESPDEGDLWFHPEENRLYAYVET